MQILVFPLQTERAIQTSQNAEFLITWKNCMEKLLNELIFFSEFLTNSRIFDKILTNWPKQSWFFFKKNLFPLRLRYAGNSTNLLHEKKTQKSDYVSDCVELVHTDLCVFISIESSLYL